jgi:pimeloyl-ACP methyl ester carboxylesterase
MLWSVISGVLGVGVGVMALGAICQMLAEAADRRRFPPPGELVDVGGHRLHLLSMGSGGGPTIVLESGSTSPAILWALVQAGLTRDYHVCAYDRAGYGWSPPVSKQSPLQVVNALHTLLHKASIPGPYLLVGHSLGGMYARLFASQFTSEVMGMVLVDARHEDVTSTGVLGKKGHVERLYRVLSLLAHVGVVRLLLRWKPSLIGGGKNLLECYPPETRPVILALLSRARLYQAALHEFGHLEQLEHLLRDARRTVDLPLVVLTAKNLEGYGTSPGRVEQVRKVWLDTQAKLVELSSAGTQLMVDSGHNIHIERPEVVVQAIRDVISLADRRTSA